MNGTNSRTVTNPFEPPRSVSRTLSDMAKADPGFGGRLTKRIRTIQEPVAGAQEDEGEETLVQESGAQTAELAELLFELYSHREQYLRHTESLDAKAVELTDWTVENSEKMLKSFVHAQLENARSEIREKHAWYTEFTTAADGVAELAKWFGGKLGDSKSKNSKDKEKPKFESFLAQVVSNHLSQDHIEKFMETLRADLNAHLDAKWRESVSLASKGMSGAIENLSVRNSFAASSLQSMGMGDGTKTALIGLTAATTSTVVLAAGWHTLAWSLGGLFFPLLPVVALATLGVAVFREGEEKKKLIKAVDDYETQLGQTIESDARYRMRVEVQKGNAKTADDLRTILFHTYVGKFNPALFNRLIRGMEDWLNALEKNTAYTPLSDHVDGINWRAKARQSLDAGEDLSAAMYGALAFEQLLREINRQKRVGFNFRVPHHNRAFIDTLEQRRVLPPEKIAILRSLKRSRDTFTHRMHLFAAMPEAKRRKIVSRFIGELGEAGTHVAAGA